MTSTDAPPALLHNAGMAPRASLVWRGLGRGPLSDEVDRIHAARTRGAWLSLQASISIGDPRFRRDWNTARALLGLLEPADAVDERAALRRVASLVDAHAARLQWPRCLLAGRPDAIEREVVTLDDVATTFVALSKSIGSLWLRDRAPNLVPLHAPALDNPDVRRARTVRWRQLLWFPDGVPTPLLSAALEQARARRRPRGSDGPSAYSRP